MNWSCWRQHFEANRDRALPDLGTEAAALPTAVATALSRSLARFYLGEAGEGRIAHEIERCRIAGIDDHYRAALRLFVAEEGRHARILAAMVAGLGGRLISTTSTERMFRRGRRLAGVRLKLLVLLAAEVISLGFYGNIARRLPVDWSLRRALEQILDDEENHLRFHVDFFRGQTRSAGHRLLFKALWWGVATSACGVVLVDHAWTLRLLGARLTDVAAELAGLIRTTARAVTADPLPAPESRVSPASARAQTVVAPGG